MTKSKKVREINSGSTMKRTIRMEIVGDIDRLPEECISHVISFTTARDACVCSTVSRAFRSAADSDATWQRFLPPDYPSILSSSVDSLEYTSKKELYLRLCNHPCLINGGKMSFALEKLSGAKCYMISARAMDIVWVDDSRYWQWISLSSSRFTECAMLKYVWWLEMHGKVDRRFLTPYTKYAAYLIFKLVDKEFGQHVRREHIYVDRQGSGFWGLHKPWQQTRIAINDNVICQGFARLDPNNGKISPIADNMKVPRKRRDEWMEVEMGQFYSGDGLDGEVDISFMEVKGFHMKRGLIVQGIEVRPKLYI